MTGSVAWAAFYETVHPPHPGGPDVYHVHFIARGAGSIRFEARGPRREPFGAWLVVDAGGASPRVIGFSPPEAGSPAVSRRDYERRALGLVRGRMSRA